MTRRSPRRWLLGASLAIGLAAPASARADDDEIDPGFYAPDEPPPVPDPPAVPADPTAVPPGAAERGSRDEEAVTPRRRRKPREPYKADEVSPFARNEVALAGTVVAGGAYFSTLFVLAPQGFPNNGWPMMIPVVGPWIALTTREVVPGVSNEDSKRAFIAADGVIQSAGAVMFIIGQFLPVTDPMHSGGESFAVVPAVAPGESGLRAWGSF